LSTSAQHPLSESRIVSGARAVENTVVLARARRAASGFNDLGVRQGDQIALLLRNDFAFFEATFAASLLGAAPVPLNWHLTAEEIGHILDDCGAKVLVAHADLLTEAVLSVCGNVEVLAVSVPPEIMTSYQIPHDRAHIPGGINEWDGWVSSYPEWQKHPDVMSGSMFYTSGTTGRPKGVKRQSAVIESIDRRAAVAWGLSGTPVRSVMTGPLYHSAPNAYGLRILRTGGLLVLQPRFDVANLLALIERHKITHLHMVPTMFVRLLALPHAVRDKYDLSTLRFVTHGSAPCPPDVKRRMIDWLGPIIHEYYAMTEIGLATASTSEEWLLHPRSVGRALPGVEILIVDEQRNACPPGTVGEICVRSDMRFAYHRAQEKTEAVRLGDFMATGDIGSLDESGFLTISDRKTDMVISGGVNIYPAEIEQALMGLTNVKDCAVFGIPDSEYGERVVAVIERAGPVTEADVRSWLLQHIAGFKVPREIVFVDRLPREDSGKIKKRAVRQDMLDGRLQSQGR
jgi:long-chain acyl-CoA synthetase